MVELDDAVDLARNVIRTLPPAPPPPPPPALLVVSTSTTTRSLASRSGDPRHAEVTVRVESVAVGLRAVATCASSATATTATERMQACIVCLICFRTDFHGVARYVLLQQREDAIESREETEETVITTAGPSVRHNTSDSMHSGH
jgi:hypothetical protein